MNKRAGAAGGPRASDSSAGPITQIADQAVAEGIQLSAGPLNHLAGDGGPGISAGPGSLRLLVGKNVLH